jgi:hypothetical protein
MFVNTDYYADVTKLREKLISDFHMKKRLDQINLRKTEFSIPPNRNSNRERNISKIDIDINTIKRSISPKEKIIEAENESPKNKLPIINLKKERKLQQHESMIRSMVSSRKRVNNIKDQFIHKENVNFAKRLLRVKSPLSRDHMNQEWKLHNEYMENARKVKNINLLKKSMEKIKFPSLLGINEVKRLLNL